MRDSAANLFRKQCTKFHQNRPSFIGDIKGKQFGLIFSLDTVYVCNLVLKLLGDGAEIVSMLCISRESFYNITDLLLTLCCRSCRFHTEVHIRCPECHR